MKTARVPAPFISSFTEGYALCRRILRPILPYHPHDYELEGVCIRLSKLSTSCFQLALGKRLLSIIQRRCGPQLGDMILQRPIEKQVVAISSNRKTFCKRSVALVFV